MLIYFLLCTFISIFYFFTSTIWKLRPNFIYVYPVFFIFYSSLIYYFPTKMEIDESIITNTGLKLYLLNNNYINEYLNKYFMFDFIISYIFLILFGIIYLDFPSNKIILQLSEEIIQLKNNLNNYRLKNKELSEKNNILHNMLINFNDKTIDN